MTNYFSFFFFALSIVFLDLYGSEQLSTTTASGASIPDAGLIVGTTTIPAPPLSMPKQDKPAAAPPARYNNVAGMMLARESFRTAGPPIVPQSEREAFNNSILMGQKLNQELARSIAQREIVRQAHEAAQNAASSSAERAGASSASTHLSSSLTAAATAVTKTLLTPPRPKVAAGKGASPGAAEKARLAEVARKEKEAADAVEAAHKEQEAKVAADAK